MQWHAAKILMNRLAAKIKMPEAMKLVSGDKKRAPTLPDIATIQLERVTSDVLWLQDAEVGVSCWPSGLNMPLPQNDEDLMSQLSTEP